MSQINVTGLSFGYEGSYDNVFENASFQMDTQWKLGLVGRNGRGKTTLLRLLLGELDCGGSITASVDFEYFPYVVQDSGQLTVDLLQSLGGYWQQWQLERELSKLKVEPDVLYQQFSTLSNGEQTKVLLATLFLRENSFLLIDEPTNHLDSHARAIVSSYLNSKSGFILVSHDRQFMDGCVDHILAINRQNIEVQRGNFSSWWENKQRRDSWEQMENQRLRVDIRRLSLAAKRASGWSDKMEKSKYGTRNSGLRPDKGYIGHKAAKMMKTAKSIENRQQQAVKEKNKLLRNLDTTEELKLWSQPYHKRRLAELREVAVSYGGRQVCSRVSFTVEQGDRIALCGGNGSGKTSIIKLMLGEEIPHTGSVEMGSGLTIAYLPQDTSFLQGSLEGFAREHGLEESLFLAILRKLDFSRTQFDKPLQDYSGGQKKKVLLAANLCQKPHLYIWDEPLNFVDVFSRIQLEELLLEYAPTVIFVEHDRVFTQRIATKEILL